MNLPMITFWDFDDTLAWSEEAVAIASANEPNVDWWRWWHDPEVSTRVALQTRPIVSRWSVLGAEPGRHCILTARNGEAVEAWLQHHSKDPVIGEHVRRVEMVHSTSDPGKKHLPGSFKKAEMMKAFSRRFRGQALLRFIDDRFENVQAVRDACPLVSVVHAHSRWAMTVEPKAKTTRSRKTQWGEA